MNFYEQRQKNRFSIGLNNNALVMLIAINLIMYVLFMFVKVYYLFTFVETAANTRFYNDIFVNLALPSSFAEFIRKPWTLITHMFYHADLWHLIGNILWLWMFGYIFQDLTGIRKITPVYIYGAVGGALAFLLAFSFIPVLKGGGPAVGASAGIMAIVVATTMIAPDYRIFPMLNGGIPLWVITIIYLIMDLGFLAMLNNTGGHIAHLAGALVGFLYIISLRGGRDWADPLNNFFDWVNNLFNPDRPGKQSKEELYYKAGRRPYSKKANLTQQRVDEILDKISQGGYHSLTKEEKEILKRASKEDL
jgi:membrane associated rhomboid family serine protease